MGIGQRWPSGFARRSNFAAHRDQARALPALVEALRVRGCSGDRRHHVQNRERPKHDLIVQLPLVESHQTATLVAPKDVVFRTQS